MLAVDDPVRAAARLMGEGHRTGGQAIEEQRTKWKATPAG
jgi:hypothetical protein